MSAQAFDLAAFVRQRGGELSRDGRTAFVPDIGHSARDRGLKVVVREDGKPVVHSFHGYAWRDVLQELGLDQIQGEPVTSAERKRRQEERQKAEAGRLRRVHDFCAEVWAGTVRADGSPVATYLRSRRLDGPIPPVLRFHPNCPRAYPDPDKTPRFAPSMVAMVHGPDGRPSGLHCTALKADGLGKAFGDRSRVMFGQIVGGAVRLAPGPAGGDLGAAEGIETAWAFGQLNSLPVWACLSTAGLKSFRVPHGLRRLLIGADSDDKGAGLVAARTLAQDASRDCEAVVIPAPEGLDWADVLEASA